MSTSTPAIIARAQGLSHSWRGHSVLKNLDLTIPAGVSLVRGDEQTGKTTLLRLLAGEVVPDAGQVETLGQSPMHSAALYGQQVFWCDPVSEALDQTSPSAWYATLPSRFKGFNRDALEALIDGFDLTPHLEKPLYMLSAGSRRKVGLCAAFACGAPLILIDQPFAALDGPSKRLLREVLQEMAEHPARACLLADYEAPADVPLASVIDL